MQKAAFYLIDRMQHVEVNEEQIEPYMAQIMKQLEYLPKEELLKRFVSLEFNRFLDYYTDSADLNVQEESLGGEHKSREKKKRSRQGEAKTGERVRMKINAGNREGMNPKRILGIINEAAKDKSISIGEIEITSKYTFFDVFEDQKDKLLRAFEGNDGFDVSVVKDQKPNKHKKERRARDFDRAPKAGHYSDGGSADKPWRNRERKNRLIVMAVTRKP